MTEMKCKTPRPHPQRFRVSGFGLGTGGLNFQKKKKKILMWTVDNTEKHHSKGSHLTR